MRLSLIGEGGKVTFSAEQRKEAKNDAVLRFIVNDTGVGMSESFLPAYFRAVFPGIYRYDGAVRRNRVGAGDFEKYR